ncbi:THO complex subunit 4A-like [Vicia villosa]|uniref:THO complex subunit 4A-like n=1 Tax=Vicia villosa TaxID=3911 RepID=UPI00273B0A7B|nr:THO complex subunit 4A-like [Vicia villosa]
MSTGRDISLDDLVNTSTARRRFTAAHGPNRNTGVRNPIRTTPYSIPPSQEMMQMQAAREALRRRRSTVDVPETILDHDAVQPRPITKLYLSNLDHRVSNEDINLLFSEEGVLERYSIHYDHFGRPRGTAEVVFTRQSDALSAFKRYNNTRLDGKPMQIELVGIGTSSNITPADTRIGSPVTPADTLAPPADTPLGQSSIPGRPNDRVSAREERNNGSSRCHNSLRYTYLPMGRGQEMFLMRQISLGATGPDFWSYDRSREE